MRRLLPLVLLPLLAGSAACAAGPPAPEPGDNRGLYVGVLPCADCEGIRHRLHLRPGRAYVLETEYLGRGAPAAQLGAWSESADGRTIELRVPGAAPLRFAVREPGVLRKLDVEGRPIDSKLDYDLVRTFAVERFQPQLRLRGTYSYMADAGRFRECVSGEEFPVAQEADNAALERGYAAARAAPGTAALVEVEARIAARPSMEGDRLVDALVVERYAGAFPGETCGDPFAATPFADTYWKLTRLGARAAPAQPESGEQHVVFIAQGNRVAGFGGCNRFMGGWRSEGAQLDLGRLASTMMACQDRMDDERAFLDALGAARRWQVLGTHLELYDADGTMVARFEAGDRPVQGE